MSFWSKLFGKKAEQHGQPAGEPDQAVIVYFKYGIQGLEPLHVLENRLEELIERKKLGEFDGNEVRVDYYDAYLYMYAYDADKLLQAIIPILRETYFVKEATATLRYGPPVDGAEEKVVEI